MQRNAQFELLARLTGEWHGTGRGQFPTIEAFEYEEQLRFWLRDEDQESIAYEQKTWVLTGSAREESHWETGFVQLRDVDGETRVEVLNAQNSGRVEVLRGVLEEREAGFVCTLESVVLAHDARMRRSARRWELCGDELRCSCTMATDAVPESKPHLSVTLRYKSPCLTKRSR